MIHLAAASELVGTSLGDVEVCVTGGRRGTVLFFPGGHCAATVDCGWESYTRLGYRVVAFSRPGYGRTRVGDLTAARFVPAVDEVCAELGISAVAAVVGVSFGGLQALHVAASGSVRPARLVLHSAAPSTLRYPDSAGRRALGPVLFGPRAERGLWSAVSRAVATDAGLRMAAGSLSRLPASAWWPTWSPEDRGRARAAFLAMGSGSGFAADLRQGRPDDDGARHTLLRRVSCPTLVTGSRHDGGVDFAHALDLAEHIDDARLAELDSPTHLFWVGPHAAQVHRAVQGFMSECL
ncbi:alpha/beta hydrolase [Promicromonospora sp. MEB111]|uniref:alpha/beta fold hydrolase n=1 Tax=Promicromonospora sp. MEB111 TaxID=3040301 RepID=UPI00254D17A3|nr:alpha/beta hydrolase [Promicromonospora sp. MEB111]